MEGDGWSHVPFVAASSCSTTSRVQYGAPASFHALPGFQPLVPVGLLSANSQPLTRSTKGSRQLLTVCARQQGCLVAARLD